MVHKLKNCIYRSPSQSNDEFDDFCTKFDLLQSMMLNHGFPLLSIVKGDFNACCSRWWQNDITNSAGQGIDSLTSSTGHREIIDKPTHVASNSMLCVDILFCTNQNAILNYGIIFECLINVTMISCSVRLTSAHHSLQYISVQFGITVRQMRKISGTQLIGVKLLKTFP